MHLAQEKFGRMVLVFYLKYVIFEFTMSPIFTGTKQMYVTRISCIDLKKQKNHVRFKCKVLKFVPN